MFGCRSDKIGRSSFLQESVIESAQQRGRLRMLGHVVLLTRKMIGLPCETLNREFKSYGKTQQLVECVPSQKPSLGCADYNVYDPFASNLSICRNASGDSRLPVG